METTLVKNKVWLVANDITGLPVYAPVEVTIAGRKLQLTEGDLVRLGVDAIVIPANPYLQMCSGLAREVREQGGMLIQNECDQIGYSPVGSAVITSAGALPAQHVIHTVGPLESDPRAAERLASATREALSLADAHGLKSIALAPITGPYGCPVEMCADIMLSAAAEYLGNAATSIDQVVFCLPDASALAAFEAKL